jgi:hypothetical protein
LGFGISLQVLTHFYFSKKDAIDVDNFSEYERMAKTVIEEKPSKFSIYVNLDDVKTGAARVRLDLRLEKKPLLIFI